VVILLIEGIDTVALNIWCQSSHIPPLVVLSDELDGEVVFFDRDIGIRLSLGDETPEYLPSGDILVVKDPIGGVSPFLA